MVTSTISLISHSAKTIYYDDDRLNMTDFDVYMLIYSVMIFYTALCKTSLKDFISLYMPRVVYISIYGLFYYLSFMSFRHAFIHTHAHGIYLEYIFEYACAFYTLIYIYMHNTQHAYIYMLVPAHSFPLQDIATIEYYGLEI